MLTQQLMARSLVLVLMLTAFSCRNSVIDEVAESPEVARTAGADSGAADLRASCKGNLETLGIALQMFGSESDNGDWPALDRRPGRLFFKAEDVFPTYVSDARLLVCPAQEAAAQMAASDDARALFDDQSYFYLAYAMYDEEMGLAFLEAYRRVVEDGGDFK